MGLRDNVSRICEDRRIQAKYDCRSVCHALILPVNQECNITGDGEKYPVLLQAFESFEDDFYHPFMAAQGWFIVGASL